MQPGGAAAFHAPHVGAVGDDVLEHGDDRGEGREAHEDEEQRAPQLAAGHDVEDVGQGHEDQAGTGAGLHAKGETGREDDQAGHQGDEGIQAHDPHGLTGQGAVLALVAAEDAHGADAHGQGEESLVHGRIDDREQAGLLQLGGIGRQVEGNARLGAGQGQGADDQGHEDEEQAQHHQLDHALHALLHAHGAHAAAHEHHQGHAHHLGHGVAQGGTEELAHTGGIQAAQGAAGHVPAVIEHPARDRGVEHHQQVAADKGHLAAPVPLAALGLKDVEGQAHIAAGGTAHGEFHDHGRHHSEQAEQIDTHEDGATIRAGDVGETPDVPEADGAARRKQQEAQTASQHLTLCVTRHNSALIL